ncbi:hypothetical protein V2J09_020679 [Rumex salicifolius]
MGNFRDRFVNYHVIIRKQAQTSLAPKTLHPHSQRKKRAMANRLISEMNLPKSIANIFAARNIRTAKEALSLTEFELMELLDVGFVEVQNAIAWISEMACPAYETALSLLERKNLHEHLAGHLPTRLNGLDNALCGGIPFGVVTELVGPSGIGKTQFCLKLALLASLPAKYGGLDGLIIYIDLESKFTSRRLIEMGSRSFPELFSQERMAAEVKSSNFKSAVFCKVLEIAGRIMVLRPASVSEFTQSLQQIKASLVKHQVKLLIIDSMACLISEEHEQGAPGRHFLAWHISFIKSLAEFSHIPVVVTNQVRSHKYDEVSQYSFQVKCRSGASKNPTRLDSHLVAALGIHWAHAVSIRLILEEISGQRFIKIAKSPLSPPLQFPYEITSTGISLLKDDGVTLSGPQINSIHCQGHSDKLYSLRGPER